MLVTDWNSEEIYNSGRELCTDRHIHVIYKQNIAYSGFLMLDHSDINRDYTKKPNSNKPNSTLQSNKIWGLINLTLHNSVIKLRTVDVNHDYTKKLNSNKPNSTQQSNVVYMYKIWGLCLTLGSVN